MPRILATARSDSTQTEHAALCVTGQLRSAPLAHQSWSNGPLFRVLATVPHRRSVHTYVVTSHSNSFSVWQKWMKRTLRPKAVLVTSVSFDLLHEADAPWTHRLDANKSRLQFNMGRLPKGGRKVDATLLQLAQAWHCAGLVERGERTLNVRYALIGRIRADVVVGAQLWPTRLQAWAESPPLGRGGGTPALKGCASVDGAIDFAAREDAVVDRCIAESDQSPSWLVHAEWFDIGSREAMLRLLKGLDKLAIAAARKPAVPLHVAVWQHVRHELGLPHAASACQHVVSTLGTCAAAFCDFDFVRAFGPPTAAYYFQESEWLCSRGCAKAPPEACPAKCISNACLDFLHRRWRIVWRGAPNSQRVQQAANGMSGPPGAIAPSVIGLRYEPKQVLHRVKTRLIGDFAYNKASYRSDESYDGFFLPRGKSAALNVSHILRPRHTRSN